MFLNYSCPVEHVALRKIPAKMTTAMINECAQGVARITFSWIDEEKAKISIVGLMNITCTSFKMLTSVY